MSDISSLRAALKKKANREYAKTAAGYFKTGKGEYGEGDIFIGIRVPVLRQTVTQFTDLSFDEIAELAASPIHEERMAGFFILVHQYQDRKTTAAAKKRIFDWYMTHTHGVNNWDLVDLTAPSIPGDWLFDKDRSILFEFSRSENIWQRRIAIISTQAFIRRDDFSDTLKIADILISDDHDLIHKAVGWMLREVGKKDLAAEEDFLRGRYTTMPRTMLRYAIEKFPEPRRKQYLQGRI